MLPPRPLAPEKISDFLLRTGKAFSHEVFWAEKVTQKQTALLVLLGDFSRPTLIFCNINRQIGTVFRLLKRWHVPVSCLHGKMTEQAMEETIQDFYQGNVKVLVLSDNHADLIKQDFSRAIIHYDVPKPLDYIGRSAFLCAAPQGAPIYTLADEETEQKSLFRLEKEMGGQFDIVAPQKIGLPDRPLPMRPTRSSKGKSEALKEVVASEKTEKVKKTSVRKKAIISEEKPVVEKVRMRASPRRRIKKENLEENIVASLEVNSVEIPAFIESSFSPSVSRISSEAEIFADVDTSQISISVPRPHVASRALRKVLGHGVPDRHPRKTYQQPPVKQREDVDIPGEMTSPDKENIPVEVKEKRTVFSPPPLVKTVITPVGVTTHPVVVGRDEKENRSVRERIHSSFPSTFEESGFTPDFLLRPLNLKVG